MPATILTIPCLADNYAYLIYDGGRAAVVDVPDASPIRRALEELGLELDTILITHHHHDHIGGVEELRKLTRAQVVGASADAHRLPPLDREVADGDVLTVCGEETHVMDVSGHTVGHIAFHMPGASALFTADSLMALGCGRLFEGTAPMMWDSLSRLAALPPETKVYSGHEYTDGNARFALTIDPGNPDLKARADRIEATRAAGNPTVPVTLSEELATNPFLRPGNAAIRAQLGMADASDVEVFAEIRARKDRF